MKQIAFLLIALSFAPVSVAQALPDNPAPPDPAWNRLQDLAWGQPIVVDNTSGPPVHCLFAGVTDAYLFCDPVGNPAGVGYRFDHVQVLGVDLDRPYQPQVQASRTQRDYHPVYLSFIVGTGILVGIGASRNADADQAAGIGLVGAAVAAAVGAPMAFLPHTQAAFGGTIAPGIGISVPLRRPRLLIRPQ